MDVVSSPAGVDNDSMRGRQGRPAGDEVDELGETEHVGDCNSREQ